MGRIDPMAREGGMSSALAECGMGAAPAECGMGAVPAIGGMLTGTPVWGGMPCGSILVMQRGSLFMCGCTCMHDS